MHKKYYMVRSRVSIKFLHQNNFSQHGDDYHGNMLCLPKTEQNKCAHLIGLRGLKYYEKSYNDKGLYG
jgi:hypothetical protein